jgi:hypothetical protein
VFILWTIRSKCRYFVVYRVFTYILQVSYALRTDKVKEHEETSDHLNAITLELEKENTQKMSLFRCIYEVKDYKKYL